jgi:hypothetical protein
LRIDISKPRNGFCPVIAIANFAIFRKLKGAAVFDQTFAQGTSRNLFFENARLHSIHYLNIKVSANGSYSRKKKGDP